MNVIDPIALAAELMRCPSVTPEDHGAQKALARVLESLGFRCTHLHFEGDGGDPVDNLYARLGGAGPHFAFAGHTDVVPVGDVAAWSVPPFDGTVKDGFLYGRGAEDMKAAIACMVAAVSRLQVASGKLQGSISFIVTGDEEGYAINGTRKLIGWMREQGEQPEVCVVGEPTNPEHIGEMVKIGRRGSMNMVLTVRGRQGHVAYPHLADNPVTRLVDILHHLKHHVIDEGMEFFQPSNLEVTSIDVGNPAKNVIPAKAEARVNIRFNPLHTSDTMAQWVRGVCEQHTPGGYTLDVRVTGEAFLTEPGRLSQLATDAVKAATGRVPQLSTTGGTSDARFLKDLCPVVEFGTTNKTAHMVDERVRVDDLELLTKCYEEMLKRFFA